VKLRPFVLLGSVLAACLVLLTLQTRGGQGAGEVLAWATSPFQMLLGNVNRSAVAVWNGYRDWKQGRAENARLRQEVMDLRIEALRVRETEEENARLRRLLALRERLPLTTIVGEVIGRERGWARSLTLNRGVGDSVVRMTPAITPDGLVGRVVETRPGTSIVQLISDPSSTVGATAQRTRTNGVVEGESRGTTRFKFMARDGAGLRVGDVIVTSGLGGVFPKGIPIGRVAAIEDRGSALFHYATLAPAVDFARIEEVLLLTGDTTRDLASHFALDG
jgi:rod shape-determining protein MreC